MMNEVASFTDAWIETMYIELKEGTCIVASFTDAWIETSSQIIHYAPIQSHLLQMRGLKLARDRYFSEHNVASFTDAWIETTESGGAT